MVKINKKIIMPIILVLIIAILVTGSTFFGIYIYRKSTPEVRYARAEQNWLKAEEKQAKDDLAVEIMIGNEENNLIAVFQFNGTRNYNYNDIIFDYNIEVIIKGLSIMPIASVLTLNLKLVSDGTNSHLIITKVSGLMDFQDIEKTFSKQELRDIDISMNSLLFYDAKNISIDKEGKYSIRGMDSIDFLLDTANLLLNEYVDIDLKDSLLSYGNVGRVRGEIKYKSDFVVSTINSNHSISFFAPWSAIDVLMAQMDLPESIMQIYQDRKFVVKNLPLIGNYTIDLGDILRDGILANIRIIGDTSYNIIKK